MTYDYVIITIVVHKRLLNDVDITPSNIVFMQLLGFKPVKSLLCMVERRFYRHASKKCVLSSLGFTFVRVVVE
jgi:hypothetical protein